jgi:hypothetical protein
MSVFKATRRGDGRSNKYDNAEQPRFLRGGGSPAFQRHPLGYQPPNGSTATVDPLFSGVVNRPVPKGERGGAMLKAPLPLTGECSDSESDYEGAGVLNGYSSSDDDSFHRGRGLKGAEPLDYDDGAGLVDDVKETYQKAKKYVKGKMPTKAQMSKVSNEVYKMITSKEAKQLGVDALKVAVAALIASRLGPYGAPVSAAASAAIDGMARGRRNANPSEEEMRSAIRGRPVGRKLTTTQDDGDDGDDETPLMRNKDNGGKIKKIVGKKRGETVRGAVVAEIMRKKGLSLGAASKYVKDHNLY